MSKPQIKAVEWVAYIESGQGERAGICTGVWQQAMEIRMNGDLPLGADVRVHLFLPGKRFRVSGIVTESGRLTTSRGPLHSFVTQGGAGPVTTRVELKVSDVRHFENRDTDGKNVTPDFVAALTS